MLHFNKIPQNTSANQDLFIDLNDEKAEKISGGVETFTIRNTIERDIIYSIDGAQYTQLAYSTIQWATTGTGITEFDSSFEPGYQGKTWDLRNRSTNKF